MSTSAATLVTRARRFVRDWPNFDSLTASLASNGTTVTVADSSVYSVNWPLQLGTEALMVRALPSATTLTVSREARGTTAASYASGTQVLIRPKFLDVEILDALNAGLGAAFPLLYRPTLGTVTVVASTYEYDLPILSDTQLPPPYVYKVEWLEVATDTYRRLTAWQIVRDQTDPQLKLRRTLETGTLRVRGFAPFAPLAAADSLAAVFPPNAEDLLVWFAGNYLLASGEAGRVAIDTGAGAIDSREQANRVGSSMSASNSMFQRYQLRLRECSMPPLPRHVVPTF